jgi:hypothetical protein
MGAAGEGGRDEERRRRDVEMGAKVAEDLEFLPALFVALSTVEEENGE